MEPVLQARNLTKVFSRPGRENLTAVNRVSFDLFPGECLGVIGESGSGKTTLANMIARLTDPTEGRIILNGRDITRAKSAELRRVYGELQMVFQTPVESFDPRRTLGDGIGESLRNRGMSVSGAKKEVARLLELCGLSADFAGRYPHQVSGGECQRAAIARAIALKPSVLICDEATSALDVTIQAEILSLLADLRRELKISCLFICHDIALVQAFCDRVMVLYRGAVVEEGIPDGIIRNPKDAYTRKLLDSVL